LFGNVYQRLPRPPSHLDDETESIQFLTNLGDQVVRIGYVVTAGGVNYYLTDLKLNPHETRAIDLRKLRDAQQADFKKNKIPAGATDGSVLWNRIEHVPVMGQLVVLQRHRGMASPYTCFMCTCGLSFQFITMTPATINLLPNQTAQDAAMAAYVNCNWTFFYNDVTLSTDWWSSYPYIATVNNTTQKGRVTGVAGGTTTIGGSYTDYVVDDSWYPDYACYYYPWTSYNGNTAKVCDFSIQGSANPTCNGSTLNHSVYQAYVSGGCTVVPYPYGSHLTYVGQGSVDPKDSATTQDYITVPTLHAYYWAGPGPGAVVPQFTIKFEETQSAIYRERTDPVCQ